MHPTVILSVWLFVVLLVQVLPAGALAGAGLVALMLCRVDARRHFVQLLKRSRWILLTLLLTFLLLTPGERQWADWPVTKEGLASGAEHLLRLVSVLLAVAWLVGSRTDQWLLSALWGLLSPLRSPHGKTLMVRLALTLRYSTGEFRRQAWRTMLSSSSLSPDAATPSSIELPHPEPSTAERWLSGALLFAGLAALWGLA